MTQSPASQACPSQAPRLTQPFVEITPEMIEAGGLAFGPFYRDAWEASQPEYIERMLTAVYFAMQRAGLS